MTTQVNNEFGTSTFKSVKSFSCLPSNSPEDDDQEQLECGSGAVSVERDQWPDRYELSVFLLTQFNVHYMSWIKNNDRLAEYMERFSCLFQQVLKLPEFSGSVEADLKDWLVEQSTTKCLHYRRQLHLTLVSLAGPTTEKKLRIALLEKDTNQGADLVTTGEATVADLMTDDDSDEGQDEDEEALCEETALELMTEDEEDNLLPDGKGSGCGVLGDETANMSSQVEEQAKSTQLVAAENTTKAASVDSEVQCTVLGNVDLRTGVTYILPLPTKTNTVGKHIYLKLALIDPTAQDGREPVSIHISETMVSGFNGFTKRFNITLVDGANRQPTDCIEFELSLKWEINMTSFPEQVSNPVAILRKLPGALFLLGDYYWHFYRTFYRWAALECQDAYTRYTAIQAFHELALMLPPTILYEDMTRIFVSMYSPGRYPRLHQLHLTDEQVYLCEALSKLDSAVIVFAYLFKEEQIAVTKSLVSHAGTLLRARFFFTKRLVMLLRQHLSNYDELDLERAVLALTTRLLNSLATITDPATELCDPTGAPITWNMVNSMGSQLANLVVECISCSRPVDWATLPIDNPQMVTTSRLLEQTIKSLFTREGIEFLKAIYMRMRAKKVLYDEHLAPFLNSRIKQYRKMFSSS